LSSNLARHFLLRDDVVFLNHGSFGACPRPVFETYQGWQLELERQPVAFLGRELTERMRVPRVALSAFLGTTSNFPAHVHELLRHARLPQAGAPSRIQRRPSAP